MLNDCPLSITRPKTFKVTIVNNSMKTCFHHNLVSLPITGRKPKERTELNLKTEVDKKEDILLKVQRSSANLVHNGHGYVNIAWGEEY